MRLVREGRRRLEALGVVLLPLAGAAALAFAAPWVGPDLAAVAASSALVSCGVLGYALRGGRGRGARVVLGGGLAVLAAVTWLADRTPLTALGPAALRQALLADARLYGQTEQGLAATLRRLELSQVVPAGKTTPLGREQEIQLLDAWRSLLDHAVVLDGLRVFYGDYYRFDLHRRRAAHVSSFVQSAAADTALLAAAARFVTLVKHNPNAEKFLDAPHEGLAAGSFSRFRQDVLGLRDQLRLEASRRYLTVAQLLGAEGPVAAQVSWLRERIAANLLGIDELGVLSRAEHTVRADLQLFERNAKRLWYPVQAEVAEVLGDTKVRREGWYLIDERLRRQVDELMLPGDILVARKNWYLSNVGLPGFWPHAILYLGHPKKLAGHFDTDPAVAAWAREQSRGTARSLTAYLKGRYPEAWGSYVAAGKHDEPRRVIEAVSEGVVFSTLYECAGDYLAALRPRLDKLALAQAIAAAFAEWRKPYDFDFDFATDHAVVCTELVWRAYGRSRGKRGLDMPLVSVAGRLTLPANEIAALYAREHGKRGQQLDFVAFVDARERQRRAFLSTEGSFRASHLRSKWDIAQR